MSAVCGYSRDNGFRYKLYQALVQNQIYNKLKELIIAKYVVELSFGPGEMSA